MGCRKGKEMNAYLLYPEGIGSLLDTRAGSCRLSKNKQHIGQLPLIKYPLTKGYKALTYLQTCLYLPLTGKQLLCSEACQSEEYEHGIWPYMILNYSNPMSLILYRLPPAYQI